MADRRQTPAKIAIALLEMGLEWQLEPIDILAGEQLTPAFLGLNPNNKTPVIVDDDGSGGRFGEAEWLAGDEYTIADIATLPYLRRQLIEKPGRCQHVERWAAAMMARSAKAWRWAWRAPRPSSAG